MSNEQIKKDLLIRRGIIKLKIKQYLFIEEQTGIKRTKEIDKLLDQMNLIDQILDELEKKVKKLPPVRGGNKIYNYGTER